MPSPDDSQVRGVTDETALGIQTEGAPGNPCPDLAQAPWPLGGGEWREFLNVSGWEKGMHAVPGVNTVCVCVCGVGVL